MADRRRALDLEPGEDRVLRRAEPVGLERLVVDARDRAGRHAERGAHAGGLDRLDRRAHANRSISPYLLGSRRAVAHGLRVGRRRGRLRRAGHVRGLPLDGRRPPRAAARRVRLESRDDRSRRLAQPPLLRPRRALRRRPGRALRHAPGRLGRARRDRCVVAPDPRDDRALAALPPLGSRQRDCDRRGLGAACGDHRQPLVRRPPWAGDGRPDRKQRVRAARLPAAFRLGRRLRLALRRAAGGRRRAGPRPAARGEADARPPERRGRAALRRGA